MPLRRLYRERWDKKIAGVCGGLGQYLKIDPTLIRLVVVFLGIVTLIFPLIIAYFIAWMIMPLGPPRYIELSVKRLYRSRRNRIIAGVCGGLGEFLNIDPNIIRLIVALIVIFTGVIPGLITYFIASVIVPEKVA